MKLKCGRLELENALNVVVKAIAQNTTLPVLNNVLLKAEGGVLLLAGTNLEVAIQSSIGAETMVEGSVTVPAKLLVSYIALLEAEEVDLEVDESNNLILKSRKAETKIKGIPASEFPLIPKVEKESVFKVGKGALEDAIEKTVFAAAVNSSRPVLTGVYVKIGGAEMVMVATDSYRLAEKRLVLREAFEGELECLVPARTVAELGKILAKSGIDDVEINVSKNQIEFKVGETVMISRLIEGKFPEYEKIIPQSSKSKVVVKKEELILVVRRVALFARENNNNVRLEVGDGKLVIVTDETKVGEEKAEVECLCEGEENRIALNVQYLFEGLSCMNEEEIIIELDDKLSPAVIRMAKEEDKTYMYIIMPLKI